MSERELVSKSVASAGMHRRVENGIQFRAAAQQSGIPNARSVPESLGSFAPQFRSAEDPHAPQGQALSGACGGGAKEQTNQPKAR